MFEIVLFLVFVSIVVSIAQSVRRGKVTSEEQKNLTFLESASEFIENEARSAKKFRVEAEFERSYCGWFQIFEITISKLLNSAEQQAKIRSELNSNSELERTFVELFGDVDDIIERVKKDVNDNDGFRSKPDTSWVRQGPPPVPPRNSNPELDVVFREIYWRRRHQHEKFVEEVRKTLQNNPDCRECFFKFLRDSNLSSILTQYFAENGSPKKKIAKTSGESVGSGSASQSQEIPSKHKQENLVTAKSYLNKSRKAAKIKPKADSDSKSSAAVFDTKMKHDRKSVRTGEVCAPEENKSVNFNRKQSKEELEGFDTKVEVKGGKKHKTSNPLLENAEEIRAEVERLEIPHLVHFTRCENLPSIFNNGLLSISDCREQGIDVVRNDMMRLDGKPEGISLSVTFPNYKMFYKYRKIEPDANWAVLLLKVSILLEKECNFFKNNAADARMRNRSRKEMGTVLALREMFDSCSAPRQQWLRSYDPTDEQAEIMVYDVIEPNLIETIAFETKEVAEIWKRVVGGVDIIYAGRGKGLFGSRAQVRRK